MLILHYFESVTSFMDNRINMILLLVIYKIQKIRIIYKR